jgi:hypothetical protein
LTRKRWAESSSSSSSPNKTPSLGHPKSTSIPPRISLAN